MGYLIVLSTALVTAACGGTSVTEVAGGPETVRCQVTLAADPRTVPADGGTVTVTVTAARECEWTASADVSWAQLSPTTGQGSGTVAVVIGATQQATVRGAAITVNGQRVDLSQEARPCSYALSSASAEIGATGGRLAVSVTTLDGCSWRAESRESWMNVPTATRTGSGTATIDVAANPGALAREGAVTIADQSFTVRQRGTSSGPPDPPGQPCTATVQPSALDVPYTAGTTTVSLQIGGACAWAASSGVPWITVGPPASGEGAAQVRLTIAANTAAARSGAVTVAQRTVTVRQAAAPCTYTIAPDARSFSDTGGEGVVQVTTRSDCQWTAASNAAWAVVATPSGTGSGEARYIVQVNTGATGRTATITVGDKPHVVTQSGFVSTCTYGVDPGEQTVPAAGGEGRFRVVTQSGCEWIASAGAPWITVVTGTGFGPQDVVFTAQANNSAEPRSTTISLGGQTHRVIQAGAAAACTFSLIPASLPVPAAGGGGGFDVTTQAGCAWAANGGAAWITMTGAAGNGPGSVTYTVQPNTSAQPRSATITVGSQTHTVTQAAAAAACTYSLNPGSAALPAAGGGERFTVVTQAGCTWSAAPTAGWIAISSGGAGSGSGDVVYTVQANPQTQPRSGGISVGGQTHAITQAGAAPTCSYSLNPASSAIPAAGGEGRFGVVTQAGCMWSAAEGAPWIAITAGSGTGPGEVVFTAQANTSTAPRSAAITAAGQSHTVTQSGVAAPPPSP